MKQKKKKKKDLSQLYPLSISLCPDQGASVEFPIIGSRGTDQFPNEKTCGNKYEGRQGIPVNGEEEKWKRND